MTARRAKICAAILMLAIPLSVSAQQSQSRTLDWFRSKPAPEEKVLEIVSIKVEGKPVVMGQPFVAGKGWFKTLVLRVRNISKQAVKTVVISFNVPELDKEGRTRVWDMPYAIQRVGVSSSGTDVWDYVNPGGEVNLSFNDLALKSALHKSIEGIDGEVNQVNILPETILTLRDGTIKRGGLALR